MTTRWSYMSRRRSSFRADNTRVGLPRRSPWPWLLATGPALVVIASLCTAWIAVSKSDPIVADNYYKLGLTINRTLAATSAVPVVPSATIVIDAEGRIAVQLAEIATAPRFVRMTSRAPGVHEGGIETLTPMPGNVWFGTLRSIPTGKLIVTIDSDAWRLPVTVIERVPATVRIGAPPHA